MQHSPTDRALLLFQQGRPDLAEAEVRRVLSLEPDDVMAHALLALCLLDRDAYAEAQAEAREAVRLDAGFWYTRYVLGRVLLSCNQDEASLLEAQAAVALSPHNPDVYQLLAMVHHHRRDWKKALDAAETGLSMDAEHVGCNNARAMALVQLGRRDEAGATIDAALARAPEDPWSHANQGWTLLHAGNPTKAMEHFREALRLDPTMEWARAGIVEALKSQNILYRPMLAYFLWMGRLSSRTQWMILLGGLFGMQFLKGAAVYHPEIQPLVRPLFIAYVVFALSSWLAYPLFNLLLWVNRFGRLVLFPDQVRGANALAVCLFVALDFVMTWVMTGKQFFLVGALLSSLLTIPAAAIFRCAWPGPRLGMAAVTLALLGLYCYTLYYIVLADGVFSGHPWPASELPPNPMGLLGFSLLGATVAANILIPMRPAK